MNVRSWMLRGFTAVVTLAAASPVIAQSGSSGWGHAGMMGGANWFMGPLMMLLWTALIAAVVMLVLRWIGDSSSEPQRATPSAREILQERFARGEIDEDEFRKRKRALEE